MQKALIVVLALVLCVILYSTKVYLSSDEWIKDDKIQMSLVKATSSCTGTNKTMGSSECKESL